MKSQVLQSLLAEASVCEEVLRADTASMRSSCCPRLKLALPCLEREPQVQHTYIHRDICEFRYKPASLIQLVGLLFWERTETIASELFCQQFF